MTVSGSKKGWYISLLFSQIAFLIIIVFKYTQFKVDFPICWDPPGYVAAANLILRRGPLAWMLEIRGLALYYQLLAFLGLLFQGTKLILIILQTLIALALIYAFSKLALIVTKSYRVAAVTAIVCPLTTNFVRVYAGPSQSVALLLLCLVLTKMDYISTNFKFRDWKSWVIVTSATAIFWVHPHSFILFLFILLVFFLTDRSSRGNVFKFGTLSFIVGVVPQIPFLPSFVYHSTVKSGARALVMEPTWNFYSSNLINWGGGNVLLFIGSLLGVLVLVEMLNKGNKRVALGALSWAVVSFSLYHLTFAAHPWWPFWYIYASRSILILPVPILLGLGLSKLYTSLRNWLFLLNKDKTNLIFHYEKWGHGFQLERRTFLSLFCICLVTLGSALALLPTFVSTVEWIWRPWIDSSNYQQILFVRDELKRMDIQEAPIFIFYKMVDISPGGIDYIQNIIGMEIGEHYSYYGNLGYLFSGSPTPSFYFTWKYDEEDLWSRLLWTKMVDQGIVDDISSYPIVIISPKFYPESRVQPFFKDYFRGDGVYIIPPNEGESIPQEIIVCYQDSSYATEGLYSLASNWSIADRTLNHYIPFGDNGFAVDVGFPTYLRKGSFLIRVHLFDAGKDNMPIKFYLGDALVYTLYYDGTMKPAWVEFRAVSLQTDPEYLRVVVEEGSPHYLKLDVIYVWSEGDYQ